MKAVKNIIFKVSPSITKQLLSMLVNPPLMEMINFILF